MNILVRCSEGHRFPVNLSKHKNRDYVFCPRCRERIQVRKKHFFSPNPKWPSQKESYRADRYDEKIAKRGEQQKISVPPMLSARAVAAMLPLSGVMGALIKKEGDREDKGEA